MIFDTHAHYDDKVFDDDRAELFKKLVQNKICGVLNLGVDLETSKISADFANENSIFYAAVGVHPLNLEGLKEDFINDLQKFLKNKKVVAIGEIGLDYYHSPHNKDLQREVFEKQLTLAKEHNLPVCVHDREAHDDVLELLEKIRPKGVVHCFSGDVKMCERILNLGMHIGVGGIITFDNQAASTLSKVVEFAPLQKILLETDAPYLAPVPFRGKRCDSTHIEFTAREIAKIKKILLQEVYNITKQNAENLFVNQ